MDLETANMRPSPTRASDCDDDASKPDGGVSDMTVSTGDRKRHSIVPKSLALSLGANTETVLTHVAHILAAGCSFVVAPPGNARGRTIQIESDVFCRRRNCLWRDLRNDTAAAGGNTSLPAANA